MNERPVLCFKFCGDSYHSSDNFPEMESNEHYIFKEYWDFNSKLINSSIILYFNKYNIEIYDIVIDIGTKRVIKNSFEKQHSTEFLEKYYLSVLKHRIDYYMLVNNKSSTDPKLLTNIIDENIYSYNKKLSNPSLETDEYIIIN